MDALSIFLLIILALPTLNLLWWWWADRRARRLPRSRAWRSAIAIFAMTQLLGFASLMLLRGLKLTVPIPMPLKVLIYLWHLIVLPAFGVVTGLSVIGKFVIRSFTYSRKPGGQEWNRCDAMKRRRLQMCGCPSPCLSPSTERGVRPSHVDDSWSALQRLRHRLCWLARG